MKFKIWNKDKKQWENTEDYVILVSDFRIFRLQIGRYSGTTINRVYNELELVEWTGFIDRRGERIYDGDILKDISAPMNSDTLYIKKLDNRSVLYYSYDTKTKEFSNKMDFMEEGNKNLTRIGNVRE